jgi:hypothetical protein
VSVYIGVLPLDVSAAQHKPAHFNIFMLVSIFLISSLILSLKSICDIRYGHLLFVPEKNAPFYLSYFSLFALLAISCYLVLERKIDHITQVLFSIALILGILKLRYKIFNSIEEIYEFLLILGLCAATISPLSGIILTSIVLASSISAGLSKLKSELWSGKNPAGFVMFATLPSIARKSVASSVSECARLAPGKRLFTTIAYATPYIQIFSGVGLLTLPTSSPLFFLCIYLQIAFALLLFLIADLSWITSIYLLLVGLFAVLRLTFEVNSLSNASSMEPLLIILSIIYTLSAWLKVFAPRLFTDFKYNKIFFGLCPFKMFTEAHLVNIITYHHTNICATTRSVNAFDQSGRRGAVQNFNSRHLQALMYPIGDMINIAYNISKEKEINKIYQIEELCKSYLHKMQIQNIASSIID